MLIARKASLLGSLLLIVSLALVGCGRQSSDANGPQAADSGGLPLLALPKSEDAKESAKGKAARTSGTSKSGPTLLPKSLFGKKNAQEGASENDKDAAPNVPQASPPEKGSPEWLLTEIQRVRLLPLPHEEEEEEADDDSEDDEDKPLTAAQEKKLAQEIERNKSIRKERNIQIIKLAEECMQKTNKNPNEEGYFCAAVHHLLDARLQLALQGDDKSMEAIYEADRVFFERNPKSDSASEASLTLVNLAHANAVRYGRKDPRWLTEFAKQTQSYAARFPDEAPRSVPLLLAAAKSCELNGRPDDAHQCYSVLDSKFKQTPQGQLAGNVLRRLNLKGQPLALSGPGIDGSEIDVKNMKGKMVLVVFWASNAQPFVQQLPKLIEVTNKYRNYLTVVGVNLDIEEKAVDAFLEANPLDWLQIFPESRQQRGWNSPLATQFGINTLPTMFLLDPNGIVGEMNLDATNLEARIRDVYAPFRKKTATK